MADLDELLAEFKDAYLSGGQADVTQYLERVPASRRQELAQMLDSFLMGTTQRRPWNPNAYEGSLAQEAVERVHESAEGVSGTWPELLPKLRAQARIRRADLVERLADALGFGEAGQMERVAGYYHQMEHGTLPARGVSDRVIDALATVVGVEADSIRRAGRAETAHPGEGAAAFARTATPDPEYADDLGSEPGPGPEGRRDASRDELDALFLDG